MTGTELLFRSLADTTRLRILRVLSVEELSVSELVEVLGQPQSTVSRHLKILKDAGLLVDRRSGATVMYSTCPQEPECGSLTGFETPSDSSSGVAPLDSSSNGGARLAALRSGLLSWMGQQTIDVDLRNRLDRVVRSRRSGDADFFDVLGARWDQLRIEAFGEAFHLEALTWLLPRDWTVADVGTGTGYLLPLLSSRFARVIAVDASETMLQAARHRPELKDSGNVDFRAGTLDRLPVDTDSLDLAIASLVLHHVLEPAGAIIELRRSLRPGGVLLLIEQEPHHHAEFHDRMGDRWWGFELAQLIRWCREAGFTDVQIKPLSTVRTTRRRIECPRLFALIAR